MTIGVQSWHVTEKNAQKRLPEHTKSKFVTTKKIETFNILIIVFDNIITNIIDSRTTW